MHAMSMSISTIQVRSRGRKVELWSGPVLGGLCGSGIYNVIDMANEFPRPASDD